MFGSGLPVVEVWVWGCHIVSVQLNLENMSPVQAPQENRMRLVIQIWGVYKIFLGKEPDRVGVSETLNDSI